MSDRMTPTRAHSPHALGIRPRRYSLAPLRELVKARLREFFREPGIVFWVFGFPLLMAVGLGIAFRSRPPARPEIAVVQSARNERSTTIARALTSSPRLRARMLPNEQAARELAHARVDLIAELTDAGISYRFDPMQEKAPLARLTADEVAQVALGRQNPVTTVERTSAELGSRYIDFLIPGLIGMNLMGSSLWSIGYNIVVARKRRLLRRYAVTPMIRSQFLLSYLVTRLVFLAAEVLLLVLFGSLIFGTVVQGSYVELMLLCLLGGTSFAGLGLLIGARLENSETAGGWMNVVQLPMWVLSGPFFSYERFPEWTHPVIEALPLTALVNALRAVYNDGAGLLQLGPEILVLCLWGLIPFGVALRWFRWQ